MQKTSKIIIAMLAIVMISIPVLASAAPLPTPWSDNTMKIFILDDFNGTTPGAISFVYTGGATASAEYKNDQLWITSCSGWAQNLQFGASGTWKKMTPVDAENNIYPGPAEGVVGYGFYYKNTSAAAVGIQGHWYGNGGFSLSTAGTTFYYVDMEGNVSEGAFDANGALMVDVDSEGYILVPFASLSDAWGAIIPGEKITPSAMDYFSMCISAVDGSNGGALIIDDVFAYGTSAMEGETLEVSDTADVSVIAYAAMAITGLGALVVAKKR